MPFVTDEGPVAKVIFPVMLTPRGVDEMLRLMRGVHSDGKARVHLVDLRNINAKYVTPTSRRLAVDLATKFAEEFPGVLLAVASFTTSPVVWAGHQAFCWFFPEDPPRRIFLSEREARVWVDSVLRQAA